MKTYEIFTAKYSRLIEDYDIEGAILLFNRDNTDNDIIIAVVEKTHPIAAEFGIK